MKIGAIGSVSYSNRNNFKNNKTNNATNSIVSQNLITPSLNRLQAYSKISFSGKKEVLDFLNELETPMRTIMSFSDKTPIEDIKRTFSSNPENLETFLLEDYDYPIINLATSKQIETFAEILGDKTPEIITKALFLKDIDGRTALCTAKATKIKAIAEALEDYAPKTIADVLKLQDQYGCTALYYADADEIEAFAEALGKNAPDIIAEVMTKQNKYGITVLNYARASEIMAFKKVLGIKAPEIIENTLTKQDIYGDTALHQAKADAIIAYSKVFKENTDKVFQKILPIKNNDGKLAIFPSLICDIDKLEALIKVAPNATADALLEEYGNKTYLELWKNILV